MEQTLSHYRILRRLGAGGMGEVYLAEDTRLNRRVALKLLPREYTDDEGRLRRFQQEAKSASSLNHPNILTIFEVGAADGRHYIATEFIDGETLRERLTRQAVLPVDDALNVVAQAAAALAAAHEAGIVHRDIKPENLMIRRDGYVKVLDFGLAKLTQPETSPSVDANAPTATVDRQTAAGTLLGTAPYMSPEQLTGHPVDPRSDIFSLGAVLYELLSGEAAFRGNSTIATLTSILHTDPKPLPERLPANLRHLVQRCLRKDPMRRYQTMSDVKAALEDTREELRGARAAPAPVRRWWPWAVVALAIVGGLAWWLSWRPRPPQPLQAVALTTLPGIEQYPSFAPDGNYVAFTWTEPGTDNQDIYVQLIGSGAPSRRTTDPRFDYDPVWSPDGKWIAFFRSEPPAPTGLRARELRVMPALGGADRKIADVRSQDFFPPGRYLAWASDSTALIATDSPGDGRPDGLVVIPLDGGEKRALTTPQAPVLADTSPALSPDGRSLAFLRRSSWGAGELHVLSLRPDLSPAGEPKRLTSAALRAGSPAWMPDSEGIVFSARGGLWRANVTTDDPPARIPYVGEDGTMPAVSRERNGVVRLSYVRNSVDTNLWRIDTAGAGSPAPSPPRLAIASTRHEYHAEFSPDGRRVAFVSSRSGDPEIWVSEPDGTNAVSLTSLAAADTLCPSWSPDGETIAFASNASGGELDLYAVAASGGKPRRLTDHPAIDICPTFSADGRWLYFTSTRSGDYRTWKMPSAGGEATPVSPGHGGRAFEAQDGSVYYLTLAVDSPLWRVALNGGAPAKVIDSVLWFNVSMMKRGIYYVDAADRTTRLQYFDFATQRSTLIASNLGEVSAGLTASPDGRTILFTRIDSAADDLMLVENFR
jgi:eukaryotic-like serine/threonine-protein kinase